jgi:hypothetical protein
MYISHTNKTFFFALNPPTGLAFLGEMERGTSGAEGMWRVPSFSEADNIEGVGGLQKEVRLLDSNQWFQSGKSSVMPFLRFSFSQT